MVEPAGSPWVLRNLGNLWREEEQGGKDEIESHMFPPLLFSSLFYGHHIHNTSVPKNLQGSSAHFIASLSRCQILVSSLHNPPLAATHRRCALRHCWMTPNPNTLSKKGLSSPSAPSGCSRPDASSPQYRHIWPEFVPDLTTRHTKFVQTTRTTKHH
jgi:hypothetical protein